MPVLRRRDRLFDCAKYRMAMVIEHFDPHAIASRHKGRFRRAMLDRFNHPQLRDAAIAEAAFAHRLAGTALRILIGYRARTDNGTGT